MAKHSGRLELTWANKDKTLLSVAEGRYGYVFADPHDVRAQEIRILDETDCVGAVTPAEHPDGSPLPTDDNLLITGDAMHVLDALATTPEYAAQYLGRVKLVYIDPPFNTGQAFPHYEDNIEHSIWLTMLRDRLRQLKPLLSDDGSIWVHLDDAEVHRCRSVLDEELGANSYVATVVWQKKTSRDNRAAFSDSQDYLLVYAPAGASQWKSGRNLLPDTGAFANPDNDPNGPWRSVPMSAQAGRATQSQFWTVTTPTGVQHDPPKGRAWTYTEPRFQELLAAGKIYWPKNGNGKPRLKRYPSPDDGLVPFTLWPSDEVGSNDSAKKECMALFSDADDVFDTPKPEALLQRIIHIATQPGDIVLDCFGGSGTTAAVAHKMGRRWVTCELLPTTAETVTKVRLTKVVTGEDAGGISATTSRQAHPDSAIPSTVSTGEAQQFVTTLGRLLAPPAADGDGDADDAEHPDEPAVAVAVDRELASAVRKAHRDGSSPLTDDETKTLLALLRKTAASDAITTTIDVSPQVKSQLSKRAKTQKIAARTWFGGGSFRHLVVAPSMYEIDDDGSVYLSDRATNGAWSKAVAAQLKYTLTPDNSTFCGVRGRTRLAVIDGVVDEPIVRTVVAALDDTERATIVAKGVLPEAEELLRTLSPGSRIKKAPTELFTRRTVR